MAQPAVTPELLLEAYAAGYFPMAESQEEPELYWFNPDIRSVLKLDEPNSFHINRSLRKLLRHHPFRITFNAAFGEVIRSCANIRTPTREDTWINEEIIALYTALHEMGHAHSVECWIDNELVGGVYGVSIGGAFFGESMFSQVTGASKVAFKSLVEHLVTCGYTLFDAQFENPHLLQFGFKPIRQKDYLIALRKALNVSSNPSSRFAITSPSKS